MVTPFWKTKTLEEMTPAEWESLCDGCGKCCLSKLEEEDTGDIHFTSVAAGFSNPDTCRCGDYANRLGWSRTASADAAKYAHLIGCRRPAPIGWSQKVKICYWWHPLVSGTPKRCTRPAFP